MPEVSETTEEYAARERAFVAHALADPRLLRRFARGGVPDGYAAALDELVIEYPWAFSHLKGGRCLDARSTFNHPTP